MKKSIMVMLLGLLLVFAVVLVGCSEETSDEAGTQSTESGSEMVSEEVTEDNKYAYLEEKGISGEDLEIAIRLNEKYGMIYEEQIILYIHPDAKKYGITAYDGPLAVAVDVSEFATIDFWTAWKDDDDYLNTMSVDIDGDGQNDACYNMTNDTYKATYEELLAEEDSKVVGSMDEDVTIIILSDSKCNDLIWGHVNDPYSEYKVRTYYEVDATADTVELGMNWLTDKITVLTAPNAIYE